MIGEHAGEGETESFAGIAAGDPGRFFPAEGVREGVAVGAEEDLVWIGLEPLAQPSGEGARGEGESLLREIEVDVRLLQQGAGFTHEGPAAVQKNEGGATQAGVVEERFKQQRVGAGDAEEAAAAGHGVEVDGHAEATAFLRNVAEEEVLKELVLCGVGMGLREELRVDAGGFLGGGIGEVEGAQVGDLELLSDGSVGFLPLKRGGDDGLEVRGEGGRDGGEVEVVQILCTEAIFEREELGAVGSGGGEVGVVEREEERVGVGDPAEARRLDACAHGDTVGERGLDVDLIEHPGGVVLAFTGLDADAGGL